MLSGKPSSVPPCGWAGTDGIIIYIIINGLFRLNKQPFGCFGCFLKKTRENPRPFGRGFSLHSKLYPIERFSPETSDFLLDG